MSGRRYAVIAGGGTAGHVLPALAVARALADLGHERATIEMVGSERGQEAVLLAGEGFGLTLLPGRGLVRSLRPTAVLANLGALAGLAWATVRALSAMAGWRPRVAVSVGGYAAFPADLAAVVLRVPLVLVNTDAHPGLVHRVFGRLAVASAVAYPDTPLPRAVVTGTPVRPEVQAVERGPAAASAARGALGVPEDRPTVATFGGSLGARSVNRAVAGLAERWSDRGDLTLYQVTGRRDFDALSDTGAPEADPGGLCYRLVPFEDRMPLLYQAADVVVARSGAMTVAELAVAGVPAVLVPLPGAPGDHQTLNARALVDAGAAVLVPDAACTAERLATELDRLLSDPDALCAMGRAARALGRPDAAVAVARLVESHAR